jgi:putative NIF3 family GTP cyclohydrolase 1 type 2
VKGDTISLLVAGATVAAAADLELDLLLAHVPIIRAKA